MKLFRRCMSALLTLCMVLSLVPAFIPTADAAEAYYWPVPSCKKVYQPYSSGHAGIDISCTNQAVYSICEGTVYAKYTGCKNYSGASKSGTWCLDNGICPQDKVFKKEGKASYGYCNSGVGNGFIIKTADGKYIQYAHMNPDTLASLKRATRFILVPIWAPPAVPAVPPVHICICRWVRQFGMNPSTSIPRTRISNT